MRSLKILAGIVMVSVFVKSFAATSWVDAERHDNIVYFLFQSPQQIARYDLASQQFLSSVALSGIASHVAVDAGGIYVAVNSQVFHYTLAGTGGTLLYSATTGIRDMKIGGDYLYLIEAGSLRGDLVSVNKATGAVGDTQQIFSGAQGLSVDPGIGKAFVRTSGVSPSDIIQVPLSADGQIGGENDSPYHGDYPGATRTFIFPGGQLVGEDSGIIYSTADLTYSGSLGNDFDDIDFYGDEPVIASDGELIHYNTSYLPIDMFQPVNTPVEISVAGDNVFSFYENASGAPGVEVIDINDFQFLPPAPSVNPVGHAYEPDDIVFADDGNVYLLSIGDRNVFVWSVVDEEYKESIPLIDAPLFMAYGDTDNSLYFAYTNGLITKLELDGSRVEAPFVNSPQMPCGLATAGQYLFVCDPSGAWVSHFTYSAAGQLIEQRDWNYFSAEYVWSEANNRMYFFRDDTSPNDILYEVINPDGTFGEEGDSPEHTSTGKLHPIRVKADGVVLILGSGRIYDAIALNHIDDLQGLSGNLVDAAWAGDLLATLRNADAKMFFEIWDGNYALDISMEMDGSAIALFADGGGFLAIHSVGGIPQFSKIIPVDTDNDGRTDSQDAFPLDSAEWLDTDSDGVGNNADADDDGDGTPDNDDELPLDSSETVDTDNDGVGNNADADDDNDGVPDNDDALPLDPSETADTDNDGIGNNADADDDGDGVPDNDDALPLDPSETVDTDNDGIGNNADTDDDDDGIPDVDDDLPLIPNIPGDIDNDGLADEVDPDDDNDFQPDAVEDAAPNNGDANGDGIPDSRQMNVVSMLAANGTYMTLETELAMAAALVDIDSSIDLPVGYTFGHGFLEFLVLAPTSDTYTVRITLHDGTVPSAYFNYGYTSSIQDETAYYNFSYNQATGTGAIINGNTVTLHFQDGGRGDSDLLQDDVIWQLFGAPAGGQGGKLGGDSGSADDGGGGSSDWLFLLLLLAWPKLRGRDSWLH
ncbi:MAG TPA: choice-of-anchor U domain-containing protein [Gammaproteobacteria bacterium]